MHEPHAQLPGAAVPALELGSETSSQCHIDMDVCSPGDSFLAAVWICCQQIWAAKLKRLFDIAPSIPALKDAAMASVWAGRGEGYSHAPIDPVSMLLSWGQSAG